MQAREELKEAAEAAPSPLIFSFIRDAAPFTERATMEHQISSKEER
jgi:hypothetical protein